MAFVKVATIQELSPGSAKQVKVGNKTIGLFNVNDTLYAIDDLCTHRGAPLSTGECEGNEVVCPWHGARFDLTTGANLSPPAPKAVVSYKVQVAGDEVQVDVG
jgi:nitrite reductase/ring-hydroxylating ferredoxin subunit